MIALLLGSVAFGAQAHPVTMRDQLELGQLEHFALSVLDVRDHRLVVLDGIVVLGQDRLEVCRGLVDLRPDHLQVLGRFGLIVERNQVWFAGRRLF